MSSVQDKLELSPLSLLSFMMFSNVLCAVYTALLICCVSTAQPLRFKDGKFKIAQFTGKIYQRRLNSTAAVDNDFTVTLSFFKGIDYRHVATPKLP